MVALFKLYHYRCSGLLSTRVGRYWNGDAHCGRSTRKGSGHGSTEKTSSSTQRKGGDAR